MAKTLEGKIDSFERFDRLLASSEARRKRSGLWLMRLVSRQKESSATRRSGLGRLGVVMAA
jgi:hypothetical protein